MSSICVLSQNRLNENTVVAAAKRGQTTAFDDLWQSHTKRILRTTYRITKNREDAEDALQDSFLSVFLHIKDFDGRSSFSTWLTRISINSALMILRKSRSGFDRSMDDPDDHARNLRFPDDPDRAPDPEAYCAQREREGILRGAIRALRPTVRQAIELHNLQEHSLEETAKMMGLSVSAAKARLHHATVALRKSLRRGTVHHTRATRRFQL